MTQTPKISDSDYERLQEHVRLLHGLKKPADVPRAKFVASGRRNSMALFPTKPTTTEPPTTMSPCLAAIAAVAKVDLETETTPAPEDTKPAARRPRLNKTYLFRRQCIQSRIASQRQSFREDVLEAQRMHEHNLQPKHNEYFRLNKAFHMRWKNIRGLPVVHSHFRDTYLDTGKPPFVVPVHYKPFNVYWDADYAKQEFIFLDAASEEKKKDEKNKKVSATLEPTELPRRSSSSRDSALEQSPSGQSPKGGESTPGQQPPSGQQTRNRESTLGHQPPSNQQQSRKSSSLLIQERKDRESTGYEGFPRDSVIEAAQQGSKKS